jgi:hypothetical protein
MIDERVFVVQLESEGLVLV